MITSKAALVLVSLLSSVAISQAQQCKWKNGSGADDYYACDPTAAQSSCCLQGEACIGNGLCYGSLGQIYRGACAGGWGNSTACPEQCNDQGQDGGWANLFLCPAHKAPSGAQSWWCGDTSTINACDEEATSSYPDKAIFFSLPIFGMLPQAIMPWSSKNFTGCAVSQSNEYSLTSQIENATQTSGGEVPIISCPAASNNNTSSTSASGNTATAEQSCSNGALIGEGVAIGVLAVIAACLAGWAFVERKQKNKLLAERGTPYQQGQTGHTITGREKNYSNATYESMPPPFEQSQRLMLSEADSFGYRPRAHEMQS